MIYNEYMQQELNKDMKNLYKAFDRYPYMKHSTAESWDKTLGDYIARKSKHDALTAVNNEKKMTFNEWAKQHNLQQHYSIQEIDLLRLGWNAGQENK